ncbi:hypothetical protein H4Q32_002132 [Labeo rohita]|uniref:ribonuclease H n=1 Tax=Labeo rohita TaxID=84645 RepID=A0ABQ8MNR5_LABRO|nr:hypothetical protein H4Q32_002132 [Labeo rohita]
MINSRAAATHMAYAVFSKKAATARQKHRVTAREMDKATDTGTSCSRCAQQHSQRDACPAKGVSANCVISSITSQRRIPFMLRSHLKKELDSMEKAGIIAKVTEPTNWVNALVVVKKPRTGKLRVCLDPRDLNKAIKRPLWPTLDDVTPKLAGAQFFSVLNAKSGYWAIKLTEELLKLTTFNTVVGRYKFLCLPFGLISAQDEFQRKTDETYERLNGVAAIVDNILVFGKTEEEHDANLRAMLMRTREKGVRLNPEKSVMCVPEVSYFA